ncbi:hypothetical protein [Hallella bergensis]
MKKINEFELGENQSFDESLLSESELQEILGGMESTNYGCTFYSYCS